MNSDWKSLADEALRMRFVKAANAGWDSRTEGTCPACEGALRYYLRVTDTRLNRGIIWIWCKKCRNFTSFAPIGFSEKFSDPLSALALKEMAQIDEIQLIERLNTMWEHGELPQMSVGGAIGKQDGGRNS